MILKFISKANLVYNMGGGGRENRESFFNKILKLFQIKKKKNGVIKLISTFNLVYGTAVGGRKGDI